MGNFKTKTRAADCVGTRKWISLDIKTLWFQGQSPQLSEGPRSGVWFEIPDFMAMSRGAEGICGLPHFL